MITKFKCLACGQKFEADEKGKVICPHCHSDNVTPNTSNVGKSVFSIFAILLCAVLGFFLAQMLKTKPVSELEVNISEPLLDAVTQTYSFDATIANLEEGESVEYDLCEEEDVESVITSSTTGSFRNIPPSKNAMSSYWLYVTTHLKDQTRSFSTEITGFQEITESEPTEEIELVHTVPVWDKKKQTYSISVSFKNKPANSTARYELCETVEPMKVIMKSTDGKFSGIPPSVNAIHSYWVVATCTRGDETQTAQTEIEGFIKIEQNVQQITVGELQSLVNNKSTKLSGANSQISGNVTFKVSGAGADETVQTFQDIFDYIGFDLWKSVKVTAVGYDEHNRVNSVSISVIK